MKKYIYLLAMFFCISISAYAAVTVTNPTLTFAYAGFPSGYLTLGDITLTEGAKGDFSAGNNQTLILTCPANFEFQAGVGTVTYTASRNITAASIVVTASTITVTYSVTGTAKTDKLFIQGISVRAMGPATNAQILRLAGAAGGTGVIAGDAGGGGVIHGTLSADAAGSIITIGAGVGTTTYPYRGFYHDARSQFIILAAELSAAGLNSGDVLTSLAFNVSTKASTQQYTGFTIKLGLTATNSFASAAWLAPAFTTVYNGSYTTTAGWNTHTFGTSFTWNGSSNIVVECCFDNTSYTSDDPVFCTTTAGNTVCYNYMDNSTGCTLAASSISTSRPNMQFGFMPGAPCTAGITAPNNTISSANPICGGETITLSVNGGYTGSGLTYQWKSSPDGVTWTNMTGETNSTLTVSPSVNTYYRRATTCTFTGTISNSNAILETVNGTVTPPYTEDFESIAVDNDYPNCMTSTSLNSYTFTYIAPTGSYNQTNHTVGGGKSKYASFKYACDDWFFTPMLNLTGGVAYDFSFWYITDGYSGWNTLEAKFGTAKAPAAMSGTVTGCTVSNATNTTYQQLTGAFTPAVSGTYSVGIHCASTYSPYYLSIDDINLSASAPMTYTSCAVTQTLLTDVFQGSIDQRVIGIEVVTGGGSLSPLTASNFSLTTTGTTTPLINIQNARLYYTGLNGTFATTTQVGSVVAAPNGAFMINPNTVLAKGVNYFWLTYDIQAAAVINDQVDAECSQILINGVAKVPSPTTVAGHRHITDCPCGTGRVDIAALPYSSVGRTTCGKVDDFTAANTAVCGATYYLGGEDEVFVFTPAISGAVTITHTQASSQSTGFAVYAGCPLTGACIGYVQSYDLIKTLCISVTAGTKYYVITDSYPSPTCYAYDISISAPVAGGVANELPCNAIEMLEGDLTPGDNSCTNGIGEPAPPACWYNGSVNTVWYKFQATATTINLKTMVGGTLVNTQIAVYSGACGAGMTLVACNDDVPDCGTSSYYNSELHLTGLTIGTWYYVAVDGYNNLSGTFSIVWVNGASSWPAVPGQDCIQDVPVCASTFTVGNPGYQAVGNICDFPGGGTNCLMSGERGSAWYEIKVTSNGLLRFTIEPNDAITPGALITDDGTDYDFGIWKKSGSGSVTCAQILAGATPLACNYSYLGITGLFTGGNSPTSNSYTGSTYTAGAYDAAFEPPLAVQAGESYWLVISNFSNSLSGFTINFTSSTNGFNFSIPNPLIWTGGASSTNWFDARNWGNCIQIPDATIDCIVAASSMYQPNITAAGAVCRSITINTGATLGIKNGFNLDVYGNYNNQGSLNAGNSSSVTMRGAANQVMDGIMVSPSEFGDLIINKTAGKVTSSQHIECSRDFTTSNGTSIMDMNNSNLTVGRNFLNNNANTTYIPGTGTLFFNGSIAQTYTNTNGTLTLNNVTMNHTGTGVTINNNMVLGATGVLTLNSGFIITGANMVNVTRNATTAVTPGNTTSYVQGNLQRAILPTGSYDFPVGNAAKGYQRANFNFTVATAITSLYAYFTSYGAVPAALGSTECGWTYDHVAIDNGYWTLTPLPLAQKNTGKYTATLYNLNYTNSAGSNAYTVMSDHVGGPWQLLNGDLTNGTCVVCPITAVVRQNMCGFSKFGTAASTNSPLPIDLLAFSGKELDKVNLLEWATATETNNDYFLPEKSADGVNFVEMTRVKGAGNSNTSLYYSQVDETPYSPVTYYKLKQVDFDGKYTYSDIISLAHNNSSDQSELLNLYPNPTNSEINLEIYSPVDGFVEIEIVDMFGRTVINQKSEVKMGNDVLVYDVSSLAAGAYFSKVSFITTGNTGYKRFIKEL
jgi:hypothetical protein